MKETGSGKVIILANFTKNQAGDPVWLRDGGVKIFFFPLRQGKMTNYKTLGLLIFLYQVQVSVEYCRIYIFVSL